MACAVNVRTLEWARDALEASGALVGAHLCGASAAAWSGAAIDSRADCAGRLFFALPGEHADGHRFAADAFAAGSPAVVASDERCGRELAARGIPCLVVADTRRAMTDLARAFHRHLEARVVAVTGSGGKTTTKEYIRAVLKTKFRVHANPGNLNSLVGVPLSILEADEHCEYLVCEVGANQRGEIDALGDLLHPDVAVITNIGDAHVGHFGSRDAIAAEKGALLRHLRERGHAVLPRDDDYFEQLNAVVQGKVSSFGRSTAADFRLANVAFVSGGLAFTVNGEPLSLSALGDYNAMNACAAFAVGDICGVDAGRMREAFTTVRPMPGRGRIHAAAGVTVIDESYNASPASMHQSLAMLSALPARRRVAVLGDMRELGAQTGALHRAVGAEAARSPIDRLYWFGEHGATVREAAATVRARPAFELYTDAAALLAAVSKEVRDGDVVLVKASRACRLDELVAGLIATLQARK
jgi:UDP-N-acetylmuramoyl-tripeptide--D-alanyl-D-alanine ligase